MHLNLFLLQWSYLLLQRLCHWDCIIDKINFFSFSYSVKMSQPKPLLAGSTLNLFCEIQKDGLKHVRSTHWLGPDNKHYNRRPSGNTNRLEVTNASRIHSGKWTCAVSYGDGMVFNAMTEVTIVGKCRINVIQSHNCSSSYIQDFILLFKTDKTINILHG